MFSGKLLTYSMAAFQLLLSPIFSYIRIKSGSVIAAAILHGTLNATGGLSIMIVNGNDLVTGVTGASGFIILSILNLLIFVLDHSVRGRPVKDIVDGF
jgi:membrane protease YdiL (CAAX protease family)